VFKNILTIGLIITSCYVLVNLGLWQLDRLKWKQGILAGIKAQQSVDITKTPINLNKDTDEFTRGFIKGRYLNTPPILVGPRTYEGKSGYHLHQVFQANDTGDTILVNRGWVEKNARVTAPQNSVTLGGYLKSPDIKNRFTPPNSPKNNLWYRADIDELSDALNTPLYDKILYQKSPVTSSPQSFSDLPALKNNHMQYALFWFFMPILCLIFYLRRRRA